jgi:23S rRNA (uridine2552-2'-O)-methyltransferase
MAKSKSSRAWLHEHVTDPFVHKAKAAGYRSRAAFKLIELVGRDRLLRPGMTVVDLGAAPGGWCQVLAQRILPGGVVVALDLLPMAPITGVSFVHGDFREDSVIAEVDRILAGRAIDLVLSDMAPNMTGIAVTDQARAGDVAELALDFARTRLKPGGDFLVKVFESGETQALRRVIKGCFASLATRKPEASRDRSAEIYLLARGCRPSARPLGASVEESD